MSVFPDRKSLWPLLSIFTHEIFTLNAFHHFMKQEIWTSYLCTRCLSWKEVVGDWGPFRPACRRELHTQLRQDPCVVCDLKSLLGWNKNRKKNDVAGCQGVARVFVYMADVKLTWVNPWVPSDWHPTSVVWPGWQEPAWPPALDIKRGKSVSLTTLWLSLMAHQSLALLWRPPLLNLFCITASWFKWKHRPPWNNGRAVSVSGVSKCLGSVIWSDL